VKQKGNDNYKDYLVHFEWYVYDWKILYVFDKPIIWS